ncbi:UbiA prenyltransferase family [Hypoxylon sp. NC1633]|nr:UbiA prenyltransferase family [Hypoxylon sp. NC1633]
MLSELVHKNVILLVGTIFFRVSAWAWNDNMDREYDRRVRRCRLRPIARRVISPDQAHVFTAFLTLASLACLYALPEVCWIISVPNIVLLIFYPFAKRFTDFPQVILGVPVSIGIFMGMGAVNAKLSTDLRRMIYEGDERHICATAAFYIANMCWTIVYDTVYAQQDVEDDAKAGVRSMAVRFRGKAKTVLRIFSIAQACLLFMSVACGGTMATLGYMILTIDLTNPAECIWWFKDSCWLFGLPVSTGLVLERFRI